MKKKFLLGLLILFILVLPTCQSHWQITVSSTGETTGVINNDSVNFYINKSQEEIETVQLGQMLYNIGFTLIDEISFVLKEDTTKSFAWECIAETTMITELGQITLGDNMKLKPEAIHVSLSAKLSSIEASIMDIAPTVAKTLDLPPFERTQGKVIFTSDADHVVMILMDGTQFNKLKSLIEMGKLPFFKEKTVIQPGLTVYPPITTAASAALLTSLPPRDNGVFGYGYRSTEEITLFDLAEQQGKSVIAVEGSSLPFNLRNAETMLSGDRDENGFSDDNVYENSIEIIQTNMPDLLYIHFHEIDDMGHTYGPDSEEYASSLERVDRYLKGIYDVLPESTLIIIFADHGMHSTKEGGNHGTLTAEDLIIPIIFLEK